MRQLDVFENQAPAERLGIASLFREFRRRIRSSLGNVWQMARASVQMSLIHPVDREEFLKHDWVFFEELTRLKIFKFQ